MPAPRHDHGPRADRPHAGRTPPPRPGPARRAAEPLAWWTVLLAVYLGLVSTISITELTVGALAAAAGAAAAVAGRRALLTVAPEPAPEPAPESFPEPGPEPGAGTDPGSDAGHGAGREARFGAVRGSTRRPELRRRRGPAPGGVVAAVVRLPGQVVADTARITVRGASGGEWTPLPVASGPAARGAATLLMSVAPGTYVGGIDPGRGLLRVHRLVPDPCPFERRLRVAGLVAGPGEAP